VNLDLLIYALVAAATPLGLAATLVVIGKADRYPVTR
jgi:hypothetical protein